MRRYASSAASLALGAALATVAFVAKGGSDLATTTWVELALVIGGAIVIAAAVLHGRGGTFDGGFALLAFVALAGVTALSVLWSIQPDQSWNEANRTLAYLVVFAAGMGMARLAPDGWAVLLRALLVAVTAIVGYALLSRVFPESLAPDELYARISQPYGYWNAVGVTAAIGIPPAVWLGARRSGHAPANALAYPLLGLLIVALFLTYSRGALIAVVIALAMWFAFVPLRVRSVIVLGVSVAGAAPVILWALSRDAFTKDLVSIAVREQAAPEFGYLLLAMVIVLLAAGLAIGFRVGRQAPSLEIRRRVGVAAVTFTCVVPLVAFGSVVFSQRGLPGTISDKIHQLTNETSKTSGGPQRLTQTSSSRGRYWRNAGHIYSAHPVLGTGAGTFGTARLRYRKDQLVARHAHGFFAQTMSDMGSLGLAVVLIFTAAWIAAVFRTVGGRIAFWRPRPGGSVPWDAERVGLVALALSALVFGIHSAIDWTWFVPGCAVLGIFAAGFVAGRGPVPALATAGAPIPHTPHPTPRSWLQLPKDHSRVGVALAVIVAALLCAWAVWQPERSDSEVHDALTLVTQGRFDAAIKKADSAHSLNPLSPKPLLVKSALQDSAGDKKGALATLEDAVIHQPSNPQLWLRLSDYELSQKQPAAALQALEAALYLDPQDQTTRDKYLAASAAARGKVPAKQAASPSSGSSTSTSPAPSPGE
ncbi:MAG TPA: O-antigen ligase family protein [Thermoleophilaceae bacterium]|nr:O-antigen ligase family protein [Thermoleophilaceae bacterium]